MKIALFQHNTTVGAVRRSTPTYIIRGVETATRRRCASSGRGLSRARDPWLSAVGSSRTPLVHRRVCGRPRLVSPLGVPNGIMVAVFGNVQTAPHTRRHTAAPFRMWPPFVRDGAVVTHVVKSLLPTYDVFDEARFFEPAREQASGRPRGRRPQALGITICEDIWNDDQLWATEDLWRDKTAGGYRLYARDPVTGRRRSRRGASILNLSASPWARGKRAVRDRVLAPPLAPSLRCVGRVREPHRGQRRPHLRRSLRGPCARRTVRGPRTSCWTDDEHLVVDIDEPSKDTSTYRWRTRASRRSETPCPWASGTTSARRASRRRWSGSRAESTPRSPRISPSRPSEPKNVIGVGMPSEYSSEHSITDARQLSENLGIRFHLIPIAGTFNAYREALAPTFSGLAEDITEENLQSRIRGGLLMALANKFNAIVLSTGNKSEAATGYATLYGDTVGALSVLADLYKHQVYAVARLANEAGPTIPESSIEKPPSAELRPGQQDTDSLPPYDLLDRMLELLIEHRASAAEISEKVGVSLDVAQDIIRKVYRNEFKRRQMPPTLRVSRKSWTGRIYPIVQGFSE